VNSHDIFEGLDHLPDDEPKAEIKPHMFGDAAAATRFMLGGNATVTIRSKATGTRFTYKLRTAKGDGRPQPRGLPTFVGLLSGPNNDADYQYMGHIFPTQGLFWPAKPGKSRVTSDAPSFKAFAWTWGQLIKGKIPEQMEVWHEARCGRCGRKLTVPESIESGFGPECIGKIGGLG
jgi:hypothetical protein